MPVHDVDPTSLVALEILLTTRSVTQAAQRLGVTQSAMSHRLRLLREQLGDPLLVAGPKGLVPTARAEALLGPLRRALADLRAAVRAGAPFVPAESTRRFVVAGADYGELVVIPHVLRRIGEEARGVSVVIEPLGPETIARLGTGAIDVAVTIPSELPQGLRHKRIAKDRYAVALRRGHPALRRGRALTLEAYAALDHLLVAPRGLPGSPVDEALAARGLSRHIALRVSGFVSAPLIVAQSDLVTTLGEPLLLAAQKLVPLVVLPPPLPLAPSEIVLVWHERAQHDPAHAWLRMLVEDAVHHTMGAKR